MRQDDVPGLSRWAQYNRTSLFKREARRPKSVVGDVTMKAKGESKAVKGPS